MGSLLIIIISTCIACCYCAYYTQKEWEITKYRAVTRFLGLPNYYKELRRKIGDPTSKEPEESKGPKDRAHIKKMICKDIFRGPFFENRSEYWINIDEEAERKNLKNNHERIFKDIFRSSTNPSCAGFWSANYEYDNPYLLLPTAYANNDGSRIQEYVIACTVREGRQSNQVKEYFVSQPYNVSMVRGAYPILGRFIFSVTSQDQMYLEAMAEESAISSEFFRRTKLVESFYLSKRKYFNIPDNANQDPMCSLSDTDKVRLCASCLGASVFEGKGLQFIPDVDNVETECQKKRVKIHTPVFGPMVRIIGRMIFNPHKLFEEWVIGCQTKSKKSSSTTYYIARGTQHNTTFVFTLASDKYRISLFSFFNNVSVINEIMPGARPTTLPAMDLLTYK